MSQVLSTGVSGLDDILGGGLPSGHMYLIEGDPGAGKTTLALQFLLEGVKRGERVLYCTLSETKAEIEKVAASHGWNISGIDLLEVSAGIQPAMFEERYTVFRPSDVELGETTKALIQRVQETQPTRVALDSLSELRLLAEEPLRYRRQILGLKQQFAQLGSTLLLLDDRTVQTSDLQPQSIAHGVLELDRIPNDYGIERRRLRVVKLRGARFYEGYHDFNIRSGGLIVHPRLAAKQHSARFNETSVSTGITEFDALLGGGLDLGTSTLLLGPAGTGKSTLAMSIVHAASQRGERSIVFAFEENRRIMQRRAHSLGIPIEKHIDGGLVQFRHILSAEMSPGEFAAGVREAVEAWGATHIVIDSLNGYLNSMPEERFLAPQMHELLSYLNNRGVVTLLVLAQRGMMGSTMQAPVDLSYLADTVVALRHFEAFGAIRKAISVLKKRSGSHEDTIRELRFSPRGPILGDGLKNFRGILTGVPVFAGDESDLLKESAPRAHP